MIAPSGLYTDNGTRELRNLFLTHCTWNWVFSFENRKKIFDIHGSFKFAAVIVDRRKTATPLRVAFMVHDLAAWERPDPPAFAIDSQFISISSPKNRAILEVRSEFDLGVFRKIYANSTLMSQEESLVHVEYARELNMVDDSKLFPPLPKWKERGFSADRFGRWSDSSGRVALPLYEGRMIGQFDFSQKGWVEGKGRTAIWRDVPIDAKTIEPQCLIAEGDYRSYPRSFFHPKLMFMDIASATNTRTFFGCVVPSLPAGHVVPTLRVENGDLRAVLVMSSLCNSLVFDYVLRTRISGLHVSWFLLEECPVPKQLGHEVEQRLTLAAGTLTFIHRRFAPEWLLLKHLYPDLAVRQWKHWWAVTEADRLRLRVEIDALCADLYGLTPDEFDWIVRDDPTDPKGFWRVDKGFPFRERLTGLAAASFRALKDGKWSAESAAKLSNDEFFALIGIPEMTTGPDPLIRKRDGCHRWKPEEFGLDDPRHGWTWDHCWKDAVALLGSDDAVRKYIECEKDQAKVEPSNNELTDLFGEPLPPKPKQGTLF